MTVNGYREFVNWYEQEYFVDRPDTTASYNEPPELLVAALAYAEENLGKAFEAGYQSRVKEERI
ncbi:hypothetical protein [Treponema parvum]|uniref:hypothetical protein n=1 Tax=Treponema parvum TaxID=138851 RepID=UPI001AEC4EF6|nr:hypothetical protein [Treponema parvum]QTQ16271.1 hypothetical protein HXT04_05980 [Treponema parvum]